MSHVMGRGILRNTHGGGTAYFTARSDLRHCSRTCPGGTTEPNFVP
jgi:hypothetical protein